MANNDTKYKQYALDVINGNIVACKYIKLASHRFLNWFDRKDIEFREDKVDIVALG